MNEKISGFEHFVFTSWKTLVFLGLAEIGLYQLPAMWFYIVNGGIPVLALILLYLNRKKQPKKGL